MLPVAAPDGVADAHGGGRAGSADAAQERPRAANAGPLTEDEVTEWIGTAGTSPYGAYGYNPEGVRIGQDGFATP